MRLTGVVAGVVAAACMVGFTGTASAQAFGHILDGTQIGGDVLAFDAITAGGTLHKFAFLIA